MEYIDVNGHRISKMTLGTVQLGMDYGIANKSGKPSIDKTFEILRAAIDGGVNSYDTANAYGDSEEVLGKYFSSPGCSLKEPFFTTKFRLELPEQTDKNTVERELYSFAEKSMERLKVNKIPVYMLHSAKDMSQYGSIVPEILQKFKNEGLIKKAGVSVYNPSEVEEMLENDVFEAVQIPMNVFDLRMVKSGVLGKLKKAGHIVFVRSVFLQGLFFMEPEQMPESLASTAGYLKKLHVLAEQEGVSVAQLALSFIRDIDGVTSLVLGSETPEQVSDNLSLMESPVLSSYTVERVETLAEQVPIELIMNELHSRWRR
jgi:aryl-alcohol dehydrogenase-like predicted oxidoreductase